MKKNVVIACFLILLGALAASLFDIKKKDQEIALRDEKYATLRSDYETLKNENKRIITTAIILNGATNGVHQTRPESIKLVNKTIEYIQKYDGPPEAKFKDCWNRILRTTNWGSDGPYGLLDGCINSIQVTENAILVRELENATNASRESCSEGNNRAEMVKSCWADRNFRLIQSANQAIFSLITTPKWLENQTIQITQ
jgi:hypothetical protein